MNSTKVILCVDDDLDDRDFIVEIVANLVPGAQVLEAANGKEALSVLHHAQVAGQLPCMILLDINMPIMDGRETLEKIQSDHQLKQVPIVIFTSSANPSDKKFFSNKGVEMLTKPFTYNSMVEVLQPVLSAC